MMNSPMDSTICPAAPRRAAEQGYSLTEMLVSMVLMTFILGGAYTVLFQTQATSEAQQAALALRQQARVAMTTIVPQLRMAGFGMENLTEALEDARTDRVTFVADIDNGSPDPPCNAGFEGAVDGGAERITYIFQNGNLERSIDCWNGTAWTNEYSNQVVARDLINGGPVFQFFDENGTELVPAATGLTTAERDAVRNVQITLVFEDPDDQVIGEPNVGFQLTSRATLRNAG